MILSQCFQRLAGAALALLLVCSLVLPGLTAQAETPASYSAQLNMKVDGQDLTAKLCADLENLVLSAQGEIAGEGQILAQLGLFFSEQAFVLQDSMLLGGTYGIDLGKLAANLPGSVFAPDSGSVLALDQQLYDALLGSDQKQDASVGIIGGADGPTAIFVTGSPLSLLKSVSTKTAPGELVLDSGTIQTTETTITLDAKGMAKLAGQLLSNFKEDEEVKAALEELLDKLPIILGANGQKTGDDLFADLDKTVASLEDTLTQAGANFTATVAVERQTKKLVSLSASWAYDGETLDLQAVLAGGTYSLVRSSANGQSSTTALNVEENSDDAFALRFYTAQGSEETSSVRFHWDKAAGTYVLTVQNGDETDELTGTIQASQNALVITADTANSQTLEGFSLTLRRDDPAALPQFQDIITMSEDSVLQVLHGAIQSAQALLGQAA